MSKDLKDKAIKIKGKDYVLVSDRVLYFNEEYANGCITSTYDLKGDMWVVTATVVPDVSNPDRKFIDHSQAIIGDGMVNKTAALENATTSAVGRALAMMGIGVLDSIASADEMKKATGSTGQRNNKATENQIKWIRDTAARVFGLEHLEDIDSAIESVLTIKVEQVPSWKVKDAVDALEAAKPKPKPLDDSVEVTDDDIKALENGELPY